MNVRIKKLTETAQIPERGSDFAAGYDLKADLPEEITILPGTCQKVKTGIAMEIPEGYFGGVYARSGLSTKEGLRPANCVGVIDADYRGEIMVPVYNDSESNRVITPGQKIAQLIIQPFLVVEFEESDTLDETLRGEGGFGSTGKH